MPKTILDFAEYRKGDVITLSDLQTQSEFGELSVDFRIKEVRTYKEPTGFFTYTGYIAEYQPKNGKEAQIIMLMIRHIAENFDLRVFFLDQSGDVLNYDILFTQEQTKVEVVPDPDREALPLFTEDLVNRFEVSIPLDNGDVDVTWDKQGESFFGINCHSTETLSDTKTLAEYFTNDETHGNPHCFVEWTGDSKKGWIEVWYGCEIRPDDAEMFHHNKF